MHMEAESGGAFSGYSGAVELVSDSEVRLEQEQTQTVQSVVSKNNAKSTSTSEEEGEDRSRELASHVDALLGL